MNKRKIPECPDGEPVSNLGMRSYRIETITPMFGGGVEAGVNDPTMPIRGTAIRGQLQFWWRATRGALLSLKDMQQRHGEVWGATSQSSPIVVEVADVTFSAPMPCATFRYDPGASQGRGGWRLNWAVPFNGRECQLPYALFPFQGEMPKGGPEAVINKHPAHCIHKAAFTLRLRFPEPLREDVESALWGWVNFGGLGGRTRRGCGALFCKDFAPASFDDLKTWFAAHAPAAHATCDWPTLGRSLFVRNEAGPGLTVWDWAIRLLKEFRQGEGFARNQGQQPNRPGRSRFPEPEAIRRVTNQRSAKYQRMPAIPDDAFPRADFGLPIVFHFQDSRDPSPDAILYPEPVGKERRDRMASPLIVKALALKDGRALPLILPLVVPPLSGIELRRGEQSLALPPSTIIRGPRLASYPNSPLAGSPQGSALEAFLEFGRHEFGLQEVSA